MLCPLYLVCDLGLMAYGLSPEVSSGETKVIIVPVAGTGGGGDEILLVNHSEQCLAPSKPSLSL